MTGRELFAALGALSEESLDMPVAFPEYPTGSVYDQGVTVEVLTVIVERDGPDSAPKLVLHSLEA